MLNKFRNLFDRKNKRETTVENDHAQKLSAVVDPPDQQGHINPTIIAAEVSRLINTGSHETQNIFQKVVNLLLESFKLHFAGIFMLDDSGQFAILHTGTGEIAQKMQTQDYKIPIDESTMIGWAIMNKHSRFIHDFNIDKDAIGQIQKLLPDTQSELVLPLTCSNRILGVITLQSTLKNGFDRNDIAALERIADLIAITIENMRLNSEIIQKEAEIANLHKQYLQDTWSITGAEEGEMQYSYDAGGTQDEKKSAINVPLALRDQLLGQLTLEGSEDWSSEDRKMIEDIATQAALSLESARLLETSQQLALREKLLIQVTSKIWEASGAENVMQTGIRELARVLSADEATIQLEIEN